MPFGGAGRGGSPRPPPMGGLRDGVACIAGRWILGNAAGAAVTAFHNSWHGATRTVRPRQRAPRPPSYGLCIAIPPHGVPGLACRHLGGYPITACFRFAARSAPWRCADRSNIFEAAQRGTGMRKISDLTPECYAWLGRGRASARPRGRDPWRPRHASCPPPIPLSAAPCPSRAGGGRCRPSADQNTRVAVPPWGGSSPLAASHIRRSNVIAGERPAAALPASASADGLSGLLCPAGLVFWSLRFSTIFVLIPARHISIDRLAPAAVATHGAGLAPRGA